MPDAGAFEYKYLPQIDSPADLRALPESALKRVCDEVREYMIDTITSVGGHFGAGLGVVELTVALHYVYNTPSDKIVLDTGHQGYPHKILTGRRELLHTIRQKDGLSGFLKRSESPYDVFGAGHASTSISAALGLATARDMTNQDFKVAAVIGDGAMTGGMVYEAMNNCGVQKRDVLVVLNDNNMSIAPNVWALSNYFSEIFATPTARRLRSHIWDIAGRIDTKGDRIRKVAHKIDDGLKALLTPGMLFEALGFNYYGPINGHNVHNLVAMLRNLKDVKGPTLLHVITQKGKGYAPAEQDKQFLHAIGKVDKITGKSVARTPSQPAPPTYQKVFGEAMVELCAKDPAIVGITAAMPDGTGLDILAKAFPEKVIDVGIAESHAVTFAAGLAVEGVTPVCAIYSSFLQRAFDNIVHDCALQDLHVVFALDRSGLVGADGPTHHGVLDLGYLRLIQGMIVMAPKDEQELRDMLYSAVYEYKNGPSAIRYPRGNGQGVPLTAPNVLPLGKSETLRQGKDIAIIAIGKMVHESFKAADILWNEYGISAEIVNARFVKPLDTEMLSDIFNRFDRVITVEDGQIQGGFGSAVAEFKAGSGSDALLHLHGIPDIFVDHGTQEELLQELLLDARGIATIARQTIGFPAELSNISL
jgi:1-deoxy-D-xylulose-5-phosphate synthase